MDEYAKDMLKQAVMYDKKEPALQEAVQRAKKRGNSDDMVLQDKDGKYFVCESEYWEALLRDGYEPVYGNCYIYDIAKGRETSEEDNRQEIAAMMGAGWNGSVKKAMSYDQIRGMN